MKNKKFAILLSLLPVIAFSQTAGEIVDQCVEKIGGKEAIQKYVDYKADGTVTYFRRGSEMNGELKVIFKQKKYWKKIELDFGGTSFTMKSVFDGENAFSERNSRIADQPALNSISDLDHSILLLADKSAVFSITGEKEIDGVKTIGIQADLNGKKTDFYIDSERYVVREMIFKDMYFGDNNTKELVEKQVTFSDYQSVTGVLFPMETTFTENGQKQFVYRFDSVEFEPEIDRAIFARPDEDMDFRYWEETIH